MMNLSEKVKNLSFSRSQAPAWGRVPAKNLCGLLLLIALSLLLFSSEGYCEFYKYRDKEGVIHFVDDLSNIPEEYHDQLHIISEPSDYLSQEEKALMLEDEKKAEAERSKAEAAAKQDDLTDTETKIAIIGNTVIVPVKLSYRLFDTEALLVLDTGATNTVLHQEIALRLHVTGFDAIGKARLAGGTVITTRKLKLNSVKLGPVEKKDLDVQFIEYKGTSVPYQGLLGMDFLRDMKYNINFNKQVIEWK